MLDRLRTLARASTERGVRELIELEHTVCVPMPLSRRISVFSLTGGVGCSTVAGEVATMLSLVRAESIRLIDAQGGSPTPQPPAHADLETLALPSSAWPAAVPAWRSFLNAQPSRAEMTITDWGAAPSDAIRSISASAHAVCLVSDASRPGIDQAAAVAQSLQADIPIALCAVDTHRVATTATGDLLRQVPIPTFLLPFDARRPARMELPRPTGSVASREILRLGAMLMNLVVTPRIAADTTEVPS